MRQIHEFRSNCENISCDSRATFVRVSHDFPVNVTYFHLNSYNTRATFVRVSRKFRIVNSPKFRGDKFATLARTSRDRLAKYFGEKIRIKFFNIFKNFATSSRLVCDTRKLSGHSCDTRTNVVRRSATKFAKQSREIRMTVRY